jgi:hypothetical protein
VFRIRIGLYVDPDPAIYLNLVIILLVGFGRAYAARTRLFGLLNTPEKTKILTYSLGKQSCSPSYDLARSPPSPPPLSRQQVVSLFLSLPVCRRSSLLMG